MGSAHVGTVIEAPDGAAMVVCIFATVAWLLSDKTNEKAARKRLKGEAGGKPSVRQVQHPTGDGHCGIEGFEAPVDLDHDAGAKPELVQAFRNPARRVVDCQRAFGDTGF